MSNTENNNRCECFECDNIFEEADLVKSEYTEYPGASLQYDLVSPCCLADWDYAEEN